MIYTTLLTNNKYSHQPYIFNNYIIYTGQNTISSIEYPPLSFADTYTLSKDILWQLYICEISDKLQIFNKKYITTGYEIVCSPILFFNKNKHYLSFIGGKLINFGIKYSLILSEYNLEKNILLNQKIIKENCFYGCINNLFFLFGDKRNNIIKIIFCNNKEIYYDLSNNLNYIYRIVYLQNDITKLLITGSKNNEYKTFLFDIYENKIIGELKVNNQSIYKSIFNDKFCIFSNKINEESSFEERQLIITDNFTIE